MSGKAKYKDPCAKFVTFGCKLNFAETSSIATILERNGIREAQEGETPDFIIVNTCSVTSVADKKCRQAIRNLASMYPDASIIVTGCYAQLKPEESRRLKGVRLVVGNDDKNSIPDFIAKMKDGKDNNIDIGEARDFSEFRHSCSRGNRTRYFLKVQDGCNYFCSYCAIPFARGRSRSPEISSLIDKAHEVVKSGGKEIVLTGVNIGDFGRGSEYTFLQLIEALEKVDGIERYRISSIEPDLLTEDIIKFVAQSRKFMPHFHIPLQSGDDEVLRLMRRHYDTALFREKIEKVREHIPDAFIGVDLITGMRGETEVLFENSYRFIESLDISRLHVFSYSEREGTSALRIFPIVSPEDKKERTRRMIELSEHKENAFSEKFTDHIRPVLVETFDHKTGVITGHTDNYIKVKATGGIPCMINEVRPIRLGGAERDKNGNLFSNGYIIGK